MRSDVSPPNAALLRTAADLFYHYCLLMTYTAERTDAVIWYWLKLKHFYVIFIAVNFFADYALRASFPFNRYSLDFVIEAKMI